MQTFTTIYRTGGTENCTWRRCLAVTSHDEAVRQARAIEQLGYKALIHRTRALDIIGMPEGWEA